MNGDQVIVIDPFAKQTKDVGNLFQSDRDLETAAKRANKKAAAEKSGNPISCTSKILDLQIVDKDVFGLGNRKSDLEEVYVAESGFIAKKINIKTKKTLQVYRGHQGPVTSVLVLYNGKGEDEKVITSSWDKTAKQWDAKTGELLTTYKGHSDFIKSIKVHGNFLFTASADKTIKKYDIQTGQELSVFKGHTRAVEDIVIDAEGEYMYSSSSDTAIKKWNLGTGRLVDTFNGHLTNVYDLVFNEGFLWSASADCTVKRWDPETGKSDITLKHPDFVKCLQVTAGFVITGCRDEQIRVWNLKNEKCVHIFEGHFDEVSSLKVQGTDLISVSLDGTIRTWDLNDVNREAVIEEEISKVLVNTMTAEEEAELAELMCL